MSRGAVSGPVTSSEKRLPRLRQQATRFPAFTMISALPGIGRVVCLRKIMPMMLVSQLAL